MRIAVLNVDYPRFLSWFYGQRPDLAQASYSEQLTARNESLFGTADFYSQGFRALGHEAIEIHGNNGFMQAAWAREHGLARLAEALALPANKIRLAKIRKLLAPWRAYLKPLAHRMGLSTQLSPSQKAILYKQVEEFRPDIIFNQDVFCIDKDFLRAIKKSTGAVLACYMGKPAIGNEMLGYDLVVALLPSVARSVSGRNIRVVRSSLAFDNSVLGALPRTVDKDIDVSFVGSLSEEHFKRIEMLEAVAGRYNLQLFGAGIDTVGHASPLRACWRGEVWGRDMYSILARSRITLNSHIDNVGDEAGNMRLYEATGVGTFLLTDWRASLKDLFTPEIHVATWRTPSDCVDRIAYFLAREEEREAIAKAGQKHTLSTHTYSHRSRALITAFSQVL